MTDTNRRSQQSQLATPPGRGEQDHDAMRAASMQPVTGPASTDDLAANGGMQVPGREAYGAHAIPETISPTHEPIPGETDPSTRTHRQPGAMGGHWAGGDNAIGSRDATLSDEGAEEAARNGGGAPRERSRKS